MYTQIRGIQHSSILRVPCCPTARARALSVKGSLSTGRSMGHGFQTCDLYFCITICVFEFLYINTSLTMLIKSRIIESVVQSRRAWLLREGSGVCACVDWVSSSTSETRISVNLSVCLLSWDMKHDMFKYIWVMIMGLGAVLKGKLGHPDRGLNLKWRVHTTDSDLLLQLT